MFTTWDQVRAWIEDNGFPHWVFYKNNPAERDNKGNDIIIDSNHFTVSDMGDKLDMTEKYLRMYGNKVWGLGFKAPKMMEDGVICEVRLEADAPAQTQAVAGYPSIGELTATITKQVRAEIEAEQMKQRIANLDKREKELEEREQSALGTIAKLLAPVGQALLERKLMPKVAGVDADEPVHAAPIVAERPEDTPEQPQEEQPEEESPFTDEEADQLMALMVEWKKADPDYLVCLEKIVTMAKNGDKNYALAKTFL